MAASIRNSKLQGVTISVVTAPAEQTEWWGFTDEADQYSDFSGSYPDSASNTWYVYKRLVARDMSGNVTSYSIDTSATSPSISWTPTTTSPAPTVVADDLPTGKWIINVDSVDKTLFTGGGILYINGPGTEQFRVIMAETTVPSFEANWAQIGSP